MNCIIDYLIINLNIYKFLSLFNFLYIFNYYLFFLDTCQQKRMRQKDNCMQKNIRLNT